MAVGKSLNKKSYYGSEGAGDIAMPPLDQAPPISQAAPDPWTQQQSQPQNNPFGAVPDELPQEVIQEMQSEQEAPELEEAVEEIVQAQEIEETQTCKLCFAGLFLQILKICKTLANLSLIHI